MPVFSVLFCSRPFGSMTKVPALKLLKKKSSTELNLNFHIVQKIPFLICFCRVCVCIQTLMAICIECVHICENTYSVCINLHTSILCAHTCTFMNTLLQTMLILNELMSTYKEHVHSDILVSICTKYVYTHKLT